MAREHRGRGGQGWRAPRRGAGPKDHRGAELALEEVLAGVEARALAPSCRGPQPSGSRCDPLYEALAELDPVLVLASENEDFSELRTMPWA